MVVQVQVLLWAQLILFTNFKRMKGYQIAFFLGLILIVLGLLLLSLTDSIPLRVCIGFMIICGLILMVHGIVMSIGLITPHVYRFIHLYNTTDYTDCKTSIVGVLHGKEITQLKRKTGLDDLGLIFKREPVLVTDDVDWLPIDNIIYVKVKGWVYATGEPEAIKLIQNKKFGEWKNDTPVNYP